MLNENKGYAVGNVGMIIRTTDGGSNWIQLFWVGPTLVSVSFPPQDTIGYCVGDYGAFGRICGTTVTNISGLAGTIYSVNCPVDPNNAWIAGGQHIYYYNGSNIIEQASPGGYYTSIYFVDNSYGWVAGSHGVIAHTTQGGHSFSWAAQPNPAQNPLVQLNDIFFLNKNEGWVVGYHNIVLHTTNEGTNWSVVDIGATVQELLLGIYFTSSTNGYIVGNGGQVFKYTEIIGIAPIQGILPDDYTLFQNYPNPFNPKTTIEFDIPKAEFTRLIIYDVLGREVATLVNEELKAGRYEVNWTTGNFSSGIYYFRLKAEDYQETRKMLLIK